MSLGGFQVIEDEYTGIIKNIHVICNYVYINNLFRNY